MTVWVKGSLVAAAVVSALSFLAALWANTVLTALVRAAVVFTCFGAVSMVAAAVLRRVLTDGWGPVFPNAPTSPKGEDAASGFALDGAAGDGVPCEAAAGVEPHASSRTDQADAVSEASKRGSDATGFVPLTPPRLTAEEASDVRRVVSTVRRMMEEES